MSSFDFLFKSASVWGKKKNQTGKNCEQSQQLVRRDAYSWGDLPASYESVFSQQSC